jgi:predicted nuclease with RNAse H fold
MVVCGGVDLAARPYRPTGVAVVKASSDFKFELLHASEVYSNEDIVAYIVKYSPVAVAIDSPLSMPKRGWLREVDYALIRSGFRVLPPAWRAMSELTLRAQRLVKIFENYGIEVIETHPRSSVYSSSCSTVQELLGVLGLNPPRELTRHEADSVVASLVCVYYKSGKALVFKASDGEIALLPRICSQPL